jgi:hypothetical protein
MILSFDCACLTSIAVIPRINKPPFDDVKKAKYKDSGIIPDYTIIPTIDDVLR